MTSRLTGIVQKHLGRGARLGYPTANIAVAPEAEEGVFFGLTGLEGKNWPSIIFIGTSETTGATEKRAESHLLDFTGDLYGKEITIEILQKHRDNQKFPDAEALIAQMEQDEAAVREFFKKKE